MTLQLADIVDLDDLRVMMGFFYEAAGIPVGIMDHNHHWLVALGWGRICTDFHLTNPESRENCLLCENRVQQLMDGREYLTYTCPNGLVEVVSPIFVEQSRIGFFYLGQFLHQPADQDYFRRQALTYGYEINAYLDALAAVPIVPRERIDHLMGFFTLFFRLLTRLGAENVQRRLAEKQVRTVQQQLEVKVKERTEMLNNALIEVGDLAAQLNESLQQVKTMAVTDFLTNTYNRRKFDEAAFHERLRAKQEKIPFSLIMLDIDHFKQVNDCFGHDVGDQILKELTQLLRSLIRQADLLIRWGGEEFLILLPATHLEEAGPFAERIRKEVENARFSRVNSINISLGVTQLHDDDDNETLIKRVDDALYQAKQQGRNRVVLNGDQSLIGTTGLKRDQ